MHKVLSEAFRGLDEKLSQCFVCYDLISIFLGKKDQYEDNC